MDDKQATNQTTIGSTIRIRGSLIANEDLVVRGRVDAEIKSTKALFIENSGIIKANVKVQSARVSGILVGDLDADSKTEIAADGRVVGDIMSPKIVINDGAAFRGRIDMPNFDDGATTRFESTKSSTSGEKTASEPSWRSSYFSAPSTGDKRGNGQDRGASTGSSYGAAETSGIVTNSEALAASDEEDYEEEDTVVGGDSDDPDSSKRKRRRKNRKFF